MFLIGDKVVHPMHGVGIIERITHERLDSRVSSYYVFRMPAGGLVLKIPTDACCQIGLRCLSTAEHICQVLSAIPTLEVQMSSNWNQRYRDNLARLKSGDLTEVARVVKSLMRREAARGLSTGERKMLHSAKEILLSELAMVREIGYQEAERLLDGAVMTGACE